MTKKTKKTKQEAHLQRMEARGVGPSNGGARYHLKLLAKQDAIQKQKQGNWSSQTRDTQQKSLPIKQLKPRRDNVPNQTKVTDVVNQLTMWIYGKPSLAACLGESQGSLRITECKKYQTRVHLLEYHPNGKLLDSVRSIISHAQRRGIQIEMV